jgi:hypothetical protein
VEEVLSVMLSPLRLDEPLDTLIDQGKLSSEQQENSDGGGASPSVWCVAANVAEEQPFGPGGQEIRRGTKHFAPHAKVYCFPAQWGDGYQDIRVVGRHRASHRYVTMVIPSKRLTNWRAELVYSPHVIKELAGYWDGTHASKEIAESIAQMCRERQNTQTP